MFKYNSINIKFKERTLINDSSITLKRNQLTAIIGKSGCGKTSLLNAIFNKTNKRKVRVLYLKQEDNFFNDMSCLNNLIFMAKIYGVEPTLEDIHQALKVVDLDIDLNKYPKTLSGGQRQRLLLSLALLIHCDLILMDEITASLDEQGKISFIKILKKICEIDKCAMAVVSHDEVLYNHADVIYKIENNTIQCIKDSAAETIKVTSKKTTPKPLVKTYLKSKFKKEKGKDLLTSLILGLLIALAISGVSFLHALNVGNEKVSAVIPENQILVNNSHIEKNYTLHTPLFSDEEINEIYNLNNSVIYPTIVMPMSDSNEHKNENNRQPIYKFETFINGRSKKLTIDTNTGTSFFPHLYPMYPEQKQDTLTTFQFAENEKDGIPCYLSERTAQILQVPLDQKSYSIKASFEIPYNVDNQNVTYYDKSSEEIETNSINYQYKPKEMKLNVLGIIPDRVNQYGYDGIIVDFAVMKQAIEEIPDNGLLINGEYKRSNSYMIFNNDLEQIQVDLNAKLANVSYSNTRSSYINKNMEFQMPLINTTKKIMLGTCATLLVALILISLMQEKNYKQERALLHARTLPNKQIKSLILSNAVKQSLFTFVWTLIIFALLFIMGMQKEYFTSVETEALTYGLVLCTLISLISGLLIHLFSICKK